MKIELVIVGVDQKGIGANPAPGGSKKFIGFRHRRPILIDDAKGNKAWRNTVVSQARAQYQGPPLEGPLRVSYRFYIPRPKSHFGKRGLLPSAPKHHIIRPDLTKFIRSTEDALTDALIWKDDSQTIEHGQSRKDYAEHSPIKGGLPGAVIIIETLT